MVLTMQVNGGRQVSIAEVIEETSEAAGVGEKAVKRDAMGGKVMERSERRDIRGVENVERKVVKR